MLMTRRKITKEDYPWMSHEINEGTEVFLYSGPTYGCCGDGQAYTLVNGKTPFFELLDSDVEET